MLSVGRAARGKETRRVLPETSRSLKKDTVTTDMTRIPLDLCCAGGDKVEESFAPPLIQR